MRCTSRWIGAEAMMGASVASGTPPDRARRWRCGIACATSILETRSGWSMMRPVGRAGAQPMVEASTGAG
jgi:hypothetical protein